MMQNEVKELLAKHYPNYKVNDASERSLEELEKIESLTKKIPNLIVFAKNTDKNSKYFEELKKEYEADFGILFFCKGKTMLFDDDFTVLEAKIRAIRAMVEDECHQCVICFEEMKTSKTTFSYMNCDQCGSMLCQKCVQNMVYSNHSISDVKTLQRQKKPISIVCPVCRETWSLGC